MRYLLLFVVAYFVFKSVGKMLKNLKIENTDANEVKGHSGDPHNRLHVDEDDIEDADFKEVE